MGVLTREELSAQPIRRLNISLMLQPRCDNPRNLLQFAINTFALTTDKETRLAERMASLGVRETDIEETFVRSAGHGGQNVNKTATCVMLVHRPTGVQVKCQTTRQQGMNRFLARTLLLDKIEARQKGQADAERSRIEKVRRQKRGRSRAAKNRMLEDKSRQAQKKALRRRSYHD